MSYDRMINRSGLSQVEVVVSSLIVGMVLVGALNALGAATRTNRVAAQQLDAPGLAHQLMGEILALPYEDPEVEGSPIGTETGEMSVTRADFDDLDDYNNWDKGPPQYKDGVTVPGFNSWRRHVFVTYADPSTGNNTGSDMGVKCVRVQITLPGGGTFELKALRCRWGSLQQPPGADTTMVTSLDARLQIGSTSLPALASIHLKNHAND
jgi:hypothetical protein